MNKTGVREISLGVQTTHEWVELNLTVEQAKELYDCLDRLLSNHRPVTTVSVPSVFSKGVPPVTSSSAGVDFGGGLVDLGETPCGCGCQAPIKNCKEGHPV